MVVRELFGMKGTGLLEVGNPGHVREYQQMDFLCFLFDILVYISYVR
jgi:hypothetical protein